MVPSAKVATYDLLPQMAAPEITDRAVAARGRGVRRDRDELRQRGHGRHTGKLPETIAAVECLTNASAG